MDVEEIDARTASDEVLVRFHAIELACHDELSPGEPPRSVEEVVAFHRHQPTTLTSCHWLAEGGTAALFVHGPQGAFVQLLVDPARRRQGIGSALLERVLERCRELRVEVLRGEHSTEAGAAFASHCGAREEQRIVRSLLDLPAAELPEPRVPKGFRLATWFRRVPEEHLEAVARVRAAMDDAPHPEDMDFPPPSGERIRATEESLARREREMRLTVALGDDGEIGSFTELRVSRGSTLAFTDDTATVAAHRGKGLARAVKLESLRRLRDDHPEIVVVSTDNAEENAVMLGLNESIGFRRAGVATMAAITLKDARTQVGKQPR